MSEQITTLRKVAPTSGEITRYEVSCGGEVIGYVYQRRVLTYRGKDGWCRGVRLRDFHPRRWGYEKPNELGGRPTNYSRHGAVIELLAR